MTIAFKFRKATRNICLILPRQWPAHSNHFRDSAANRLCAARASPAQPVLGAAVLAISPSVPGACRPRDGFCPDDP